MRLFAALVCISCVSLAAPAARGAQRTALTLEAPVPAAPRYSQAVSVVVTLTLEDGTPLGGPSCTPACSVVVDVGPAGSDERVNVNPQGFVLGQEDGAATARVTFVDGRYEDGSAFPTAVDGAPYVIRARFLGTGAGQVQGNPDCVAGAPEEADGAYCPSQAEVEVPLFPETAEIAPGAGLEGALGDEIVLSAALEDPNGEAALGGTDVDGAGPLALAGREVRFFYDVDNDGNAEASEEVPGSPTVTNEAGVASLAFTLDPAFIRAGTYEGGLQVEFGGDGRYGVARAGARVVVRPADVDVARTVIEVDPPVLPADGFSKSVITVRLVDEFNNPLDETSEPHEVVLTADNGILLEEVELDLLTGVYTQTLQAQRRDGPATIRATVDGVEVPATATVEIEGEGGCRCGARTTNAGPAALAGLAAALLLVRRVSKRRSR